jgi:CheY-like chemotaxis protein
VVNVMFVDDEPDILAGLRRLLRPRRHEWAMTFAASGQAAVEALDDVEFDVVVADMRMPGMDGAELLGIVRRRQPSAVRIILSGHAAESSTVRSLPVAHQFLSKPCEPDRLQRVIERSLDTRTRLGDAAVLRCLGALAGLPSPSATVVTLQLALAEAVVDPDDVANIVATDPAMTSKLLQIANSAFYGLPRTLDDPLEAVRFLGAPVVGEIVVSTELLDSLARRLPHVDAALDELRARALRRAGLASALATLAGHPVAAARRIWTDAFLAEVGELLFLDCSTPSEAAIGLRRTAGGALLAMWGLPHHLVETAVLCGDRPNRDATDGHRFTWLASGLMGGGLTDDVREVASDVGVGEASLRRVMDVHVQPSASPS